MVKVAIAGGSRGIGKAIATGIAERGIHSIIILTRNNNTTTNNSHNQSNNDPKTKTLAVDYSDLSSLQNQLEEEDIHTVISALSFRNEDSVKAQLNLIDVAEWASCTRRFMPSGFGAVHTDEYASFPPRHNSLVELSKSKSN